MSLCRNDPFRLVGGLIPRRELALFIHVRAAVGGIPDKPILLDKARGSGADFAACVTPRIILALPVFVVILLPGASNVHLHIIGIVFCVCKPIVGDTHRGTYVPVGNQQVIRPVFNQHVVYDA